MMTRRAFSCAGLWTGVLAMLGLSSCESPAPVEDLVAGEDLFSVGYSYGGGMDVDGMFTVSSQQDIDDLQREGFRKACAMLKQLAGD